MYILASHLDGLPILSLRNGQPVALAGQTVIDPDKLEVVAVYCQSGSGPWRKNTAVILARDIREVAREGIVIDSLEDIEEVSEIVRLKAVIDKHFQPKGAPVMTESGHQLGKVEDYTINVKSFLIQKLYVRQSIIKNLLLNNLVIDRSQVVQVTPQGIVVRDASVKDKRPALSPRPISPPVP
ncbi:hypothetical protein KY386_01740 [Candidatus Parcubacteria bacterium]|nr:hypothetical protein [Candidatus Parcubacteria bacterium]